MKMKNGKNIILKIILKNSGNIYKILIFIDCIRGYDFIGPILVNLYGS